MFRGPLFWREMSAFPLWGVASRESCAVTRSSGRFSGTVPTVFGSMCWVPMRSVLFLVRKTCVVKAGVRARHFCVHRHCRGKRSTYRRAPFSGAGTP